MDESHKDVMPKIARPRFPEGYGFTPKTPHLPPAWTAIVQKIELARNYWICTASRSGMPHAMPVWGVWFEDRLYFVTKRASKKARNLYNNPQVVVHLESGDDLVVLEGAAHELDDPALFGQVARAYSEKYKGDQIYQDIEGIFALQLHVAFTWSESDFHGTATKWSF